MIGESGWDGLLGRVMVGLAGRGCCGWLDILRQVARAVEMFGGVGRCRTRFAVSCKKIAIAIASTIVNSPNVYGPRIRFTMICNVHPHSKY